ncbi:hypothetical protein ACWEOW_17625 [Monashia sp. NPDC004114]
MTTTIHPTRQAQRLHLSHLATTHRAPLSKRPDGAAHQRVTGFIPMARDPLSVERAHQSDTADETRRNQES